MKRIFVFASLFCFMFSGVLAQDVTTVEATDSDISENLDLEAVASVFGEAEDLEDFEKKLNDPETQISNLDLNEDGEVDYLRVVETSKKETHLVTVQAVIGEDEYQDVATIDVEKDEKGETQVQVVGDVYMYGTNYVITPVYVHPPVIFVWFWGPYYSPWRSPYRWGYYPPYYRPWTPYPPYRYRSNVNVHINVRNTYNVTSVRNSTTAVELQKENRRNDYGAKNPDKSFNNRNEGAGNRQDLKAKPAPAKENKAGGSEPKTDRPQSTGREVQKDWKPQSERQGNNSKIQDNKVSVPSTGAPKDLSQPKTTQRPSGNSTSNQNRSSRAKSGASKRRGKKGN